MRKGNPLYIINPHWMFNSDTLIGYKTDVNRKGTLKSCTPAFQFKMVTDGTGSQSYQILWMHKSVPYGILRKSKNIITKVKGDENGSRAG